MVSGDVDGDGRDEILLGSCMLDDNGTLLWSSGLGHSDKAYLTDIDPRRPGMEVFLAIDPLRRQVMVYLCSMPQQVNGYGVSVTRRFMWETAW